MLNRNLIAGEWTAGSFASRNTSPSDISDLIGEYASADAQDVDRAIEAAAAAFPGWSRATPEFRSDILDRVGTEILARQEEIGRILAREEGKTLPEAIAEASRAGRIFRYFAGEALRLEGERLDSIRAGIEVEIIREPEGVIGIITPWNFPIAIPAWKIAPALAYGNTVVFKPADLVPGCAWIIADVLHRAGIPSGVFNLVMGKGSIVGEVIVRSPRVRAVSFTGSVPTGRRIGVECMERGKKVQLELGGKNPLIVAADADLDVAVNVALNGSYFSTGQRCTASSRLIVDDAIHDKFVEHLVEAMGRLKVDNSLNPGTDVGPVASQSQLEQDLKYIDIGRAEGARLAFGGELIKAETEGYFLKPALFVDSTNEMRINREEIFGPVASVIRVKNYEEAVAVANDTEFGLASGISTTSLKLASDFKRRSQAGMVMVNVPTAGVDYHVPFGGRKASSYGPREQGKHAREFYTSLKTVYVQS
ncbi:aldehyde dehydrogenase family protein [Microvirga zambiensis]|uniref:aldehyde dehydrogenase family protein n=1 Tax=Microvirga zambiensis TaxID=1402137 RepID=UPI00191D5FCF|nr:aldehyde dehydrogenase family protein [Microvirga zambiensis]